MTTILYCTECGKKLNLLRAFTTTRYDRNTGEASIVINEIYGCKDYMSGYSDRVWHVHDMIRVRDGIVIGECDDDWLL